MLRMYDLIEKKERGKELSEDEIRFFVSGVTDGSIPDYQISAMLMAIFFRGMSNPEIFTLTDAMAHSGDVADLSGIRGRKADKHSTGGVGDKTSLIVAPMVAAAGCGISVAKMSGRGLGHTGGTVDKLESIPGVQTSLPADKFFDIVNRTGLCIIGQSGSFAPADKKLYALRDVTATVNCIPLIASSIMAKKLAAGSDYIVLDVKCGSGAFIKNEKEAENLAKLMVDIGENAGKKVAALITDMDVPLGHAVGNSLEVIEAIETLSGRGDEDLTVLCTALAANMLYTAGVGDYGECEQRVSETLKNGLAKKKLADMIEAMGGDPAYVYDTSLFRESRISAVLASEGSGYVTRIDTEEVGKAAAVLGAGRAVKDQKIDHSAGIILHKKTGDKVKEGDVLATLFTSTVEKAQSGMEMLYGAVTFGDKPPKKKPLIYKTVRGI